MGHDDPWVGPAAEVGGIRMSTSSAGDPTDIEVTDGADSGPALHPVLHVIAPLAALAATWGIRKGLAVAYRSATGSPPPLPDDPGVPLRKALVWTLATTASAAVVEMLILRAANRRAR